MPSDTATPGRARTRFLVVVVTAALQAALVGALAPMTAEAAGTVLFDNLFNDRTVDGTGTVTVPNPVSGTNVACLTASGNSATLPLLSCSGTTDSQGSGRLRLTPAAQNQVGGVFGQNSFPSSAGLDITFTTYQWGGGNGADGIAFMLAAVDPANPSAPASIGSAGGALGYSVAPGLNGLTNAYLGVGFDVFGKFSDTPYTGTGCTNPPNISGPAPGSVVVRGPGSGSVGYCGLATTYDGTVGSKLALRAPTRANSDVPVQVLINPTGSAYTSASGITVAAGAYKIVFTPVHQSAQTLTGTLPAVTAGLYPSATWLTAGGLPKQLAFGFVASTNLGSSSSATDVHEITNVKAVTFAAVPQLAVSGTSYTATTSQPGDPVTYTIATSVLAGAAETTPISVTQTAPAGVAVVGAYGTGWVCQPPVGPAVTCTTSGSSFSGGTALPVITVAAVVTGSGVTSTLVQNASTARASSADASPATDLVMTAGTLPAAPAAITLTPAIGSVAGGGAVTVGGTNIVAATAIEIGTTAQQQAGTPVTLLPCPGAAAPGCFTVSGATLVISSMPARAGAATVSVTVVTAGVAAAASYVYADKPAAPAAPTATAGVTSASLSWAAPASNGSAITGYVVTPSLAGVAQTPQSFDASTTTRTITGLTAGGSYTFTVAAVNAYGTSTASAPSGAVVPYALPGAPSITTATAGDSAATLTWTTPGDGGSAITGYLVTPYIGAAAQPTQAFTGSATTRTVTGLTAGTAYTFTVAAQNLAGTGPASAASSPVTPNVSPSLDFAAPPAGEVSVAYSQQLTVTNGTSPFTWSISSGTLPAGLTLNASTGLLGGTPTAAGSFPVTVRVIDASGEIATKAVTLVIAAAPTVTFSPPAGEVGVAYSQQPTVTGGTGPFTWAVSAGSLPAGLTLNPITGLLSGTPTAAGSFSVTITVTDAFSQVANKTVALVIAALPAFTATAAPAGQAGVAYSHAFAVTGGTAPLTWSVTAGSPPPGLTLAAGTGVLSGTPTAVGSVAFTVSVTDALSQTDSKAVTLVVATGPLLIVKSANTSSAVAGSAVGYTITVTNTAATPFTGVAASDVLTGVLDDAVYNADATASAGTLSYTAPALGWTGNLAAGASVTIGYSVTVNNPDTGNKVLSNTVTSTTVGTNCAGGSGDSRCAATVTVPGLTIVKTAGVATTTPGAVVGFSIVVTNTGQSAYPSATLTDELAAVLDDATYDGNGTATSGSVTHAGSTLSWAGALAIGASVTITYSVTVADPDNGDRSLTGTVVSPSAGSPCPSGNPAAQCTATVTVLVPGLSITNSADTSTTTPGAGVAYTVTLTNTGQTAYTAATVTVALAGALDDASYDGNAGASAGSVVFNAGTPALVWTGDLATAAVVTITASVTVANPDAGDEVLHTVATSAAPGSTCPSGGSNPACTATVHVLIPGLTIALSAGAGTTTPGSAVSYTVAVTNTGQTPYTGATVSAALAGVLDDAAYNGDAAASAGSVSVTGATLTWTGDLLIGASATITFSVAVDDPDTGDLTLDATVTSTAPGNNCPAAGSDPRCASTVTVLVPGLSISTTADATTTTPDAVVSYAVTVLNSGQTAYNGLAVTIDRSAALDDATDNEDETVTSGSLSEDPDNNMLWVLNLAPGASASAALSLTVRSPATGDRSLSITVVSDAPGSPCPTGSADADCHATVTVLVPGLTITKTASASTATPGGAVGYTISVVNDGETTYPAASFTDDLATVLTDATYSGDATTTTGTLSYAAPVLSWTGALDPAESATITYSVTVRDPDPGDKQFYNTVVSAAAGSNCPAGGADARCTASVNVLVPGLTIVTTASTPTAKPGDVVGYTVTVTNSGATPVTAATLSDSLAGVLDDAGYNDDAGASAGTVGLAGSDLTWTGDLALGATATITYTVTVHAADGGDNLVTDTVTSTTAGNNCGAGSTDARCTATVPVARLVLSQGYEEASTTPGSLVHLSATFTNTGQVPYTGITVSSASADTVDDAIPTGDQAASTGTLELTSTAITWTGSIPIGGVVTVAGTLTVKDPDPGNKVLTGTLVSAAPGNNCPTGGVDSQCVSLLTVLLPELTISKTASTTATVLGGSVSYTITVQNTGQAPYTAAAVADSMAGVLDKASYDDNAEASTGTLTFSSPTLSWTGNLAVAASATITYSITVDSVVPGDKTLVNSVSSTTVGSTCPPSSGNTACRRVVAILTPALSIEKVADLANATPGTVVTYTVTVTNSGQTSYPAAELTDSLADVLDDATYNADADASSGTVGYSDGVLSWSGALATATSATITYTVTIDDPGTGDGTMTNTVASASAGSNCPSGEGDTRCTATVAVTEAADLTFTKTADVTATVAGDVVQYTVTVTNSGETEVTGADFTDPLADILDDATYNDDETADGGTTVTYNEPDLSWTGTVPAESTITVTYSVTVHTTVTGDQILAGTLSSTSPSTGNDCLAASSDPRCTSTVPVAALLIDQDFVESSVTPGMVVHFLATFTNTGKLAFTGIVVSNPAVDVIDDAIPNGHQLPSSGTLVLTSTALTWTGNIPVGGSVTVTGDLTVKNPDPGNKLITGTAVSDALGSNCPEGTADTRCTAATPVLLPGLTITKTAGTTFVVPGGTAGYTVTVHNTGETPYLGATVTDTLAGVLDDAAYNDDVDADTGTASFASPVLTWTGDLDMDATATITYSVTADNPATGDKTMINPVSSTEAGSTCPPASGNTACRSTVAVLTPALTITSVASVTTTVPGATVTYTLTATNTGQIPYAAASLGVALDGVLDDATYGGDASATSGTAGFADQTVTWTGALGTTATVTITYTVIVDQPVTGDFLLDQTLTSTTPGNNCPSSGTDPRCTTSVAVAGLHIVNTADTATTTPTSVVGHTVTFTNAGQVPYVGVSITDSLAGALDDATYNGDAQASAGSLLLDPVTGEIGWTGDLPVGGATVTVTNSVTVDYPDLGDKDLSTLLSTGAAASNCPPGSTDPACATSVAVLTPELSIDKAADTATTTPGSQVGYTITVTNTGETPYTAATVRDSLAGVLANATYNNDADADSGDVSFTSPTLTWTGDLALDQTVVITYSVEVHDPEFGDKLLINAVESGELGSGCPTGEPAPSCSTTVTVLVPALDIAVSADSTSSVPGGTVGYTVTVHNTGQTGYLGAGVTVQLSGVLDDAGYAGGASATVGTVTFSSPALSWTGDLTAGATAVISYVVTVADPDTGNRLLTTSATSAAPGSTCGAAPQCVNTVTVLVPGLAVSTTAGVATATPGDQVAFTITVSNTGETPYTATTVSTALTGVLDDATFDGDASASLGIATYTAPDLSWTGTLPVGASATISYAVTVRSPDPGDKVLSTTVVAPAQGSTCQQDSGDPACTAEVSVLVPGLTIDKSASASATTPGAVVSYTIVVTNTGQTTYDDAVVHDSLSRLLPDADYNGDAAVDGGGAVTYAGSTLTWTGDLALEAEATITFSITVHDPATGDRAIANEVTSTAPGSTCPPGGTLPACSTLVQVLVPELTITSTADTTTVAAGSAVHYTVTAANTGETAYAAADFTDDLDDVLDDADYTGDADADIGTVEYANGTLAWTGALGLGETATITYTVVTYFPATGDRTLTNAVFSASPGATCGGGTAPPCGATVTVLVPALTVTKTADASEVVAGGTLQYTISAANTGQTDYPLATLTDTLSGVIDDAAYNGDASATTGSVGYLDGTLSWSGALSTGAAVLISYSVTVPTTGTGDGNLTNRVMSTAVGSTCTADLAGPLCVTSTTIAARTITLTGITPSFTLTGLPNSTVSSDGTVTMTITTNSTGGYQLSVQAEAAVLTGAELGNTATIPITALSVRETGTSQFHPLSADTPLVVHQQDAPSAPGGDAVSTDYQVQIPFVESDTYTATLDYIVSAQ